MPSVRLNVLQLISVGMVAAALGGGVVYQVLVSSTVKCLVAAPASPHEAPTDFLKSGPMDTTHGRQF